MKSRRLAVGGHLGKTLDSWSNDVGVTRTGLLAKDCSKSSANDKVIPLPGSGHHLYLWYGDTGSLQTNSLLFLGRGVFLFISISDIPPLPPTSAIRTNLCEKHPRVWRLPAFLPKSYTFCHSVWWRCLFKYPSSISFLKFPLLEQD